MAERSAENLITGIANSREIPFERVLFALGIRFVGETVAKKLARSFRSVDALAKADTEQLVAVDEIGIKIAESVVEFFRNEKNIEIVERLRNYGVKLELPEGEGVLSSERFKGMNFVVSGVFADISRNDLKKLIEDNGGKVVSSISSKTTYLVAGDKMGPSKREKADNLGVPIISEQEFMKMLE
jgi:DNA ligase (NAD+)